MELPSNRARLAKALFSLDAVLGVLTIGGAALYGAAWSSGSAWGAFLATFLPASALWLAVCYGAYRGLASDRAAPGLVFWLYVAGNAIAFPVGTAIAGASVWLWREARKPGSSAPPA